MHLQHYSLIKMLVHFYHRRFAPVARLRRAGILLTASQSGFAALPEA
jgi:hypothetical protein